MKKKRALILFGLVGLAAATDATAFPWYASGEGIWGAQLMTPAERSEYVQGIRGMKDYETCKAYIEDHRMKILERAQTQGIALPPPPSGSPCDVMQRMGRFSGNAPACPSDK